MIEEKCKDCYFYLERFGEQTMNIHGCVWCNKYHRINYWQPPEGHTRGINDE